MGKACGNWNENPFLAKVASHTAGAPKYSSLDPEDDRPYQANDCGKEGTDVGEVQRARNSQLLLKTKAKSDKTLVFHIRIGRGVVQNFGLA